MIVTVNKTQQIKEKLAQAGKVVGYLNQAHHIKAIADMDKEMEDVRRDYKVKERDSHISASEITLTS
jgi:hypothetical protein